jgi:TolB-like protein
VLEQVEREKVLPPINTTDSIGVLNFSNQSGNFDWDPLQKGMVLMLNHDFNKISYKLDVMERVRMQALVEELGMGTSGIVEGETTGRIGRLLEVQYLAKGTINRGAEKSLQLNPTFHRIPEEETLDLPQADGDINGLTGLEKQVLFDTLEEIGIELTPDERTKLGKPMSDNPAALMAYFKGVDYSDNGEYEKAADMYKKALAEDPNLKAAEEGVAELEKLKLVEPEELPPPEKKEMSTTKKVMLGAGAALAVGAIVGGAVAGAVYAADSLSDDDDDGDSGDSDSSDSDADTTSDDTGGDDTTTEDDEEEEDDVRPFVTHTTPVDHSTVECQEDEVFIHWSEPMDADSGWIAVGPPDWNDGPAWIVDWSSDRTSCRVYWEHPDTDCGAGGKFEGETLILEPKRYRDVNGNNQSGEPSFKFRVVDTIP